MNLCLGPFLPGVGMETEIAQLLFLLYKTRVIQIVLTLGRIFCRFFWVILYNVAGKWTGISVRLESGSHYFSLDLRLAASTSPMSNESGMNNQS